MFNDLRLDFNIFLDESHATPFAEYPDSNYHLNFVLFYICFSNLFLNY